MRQDVGNQERVSLAHVDGAGSEVLDQDSLSFRFLCAEGRACGDGLLSGGLSVIGEHAVACSK